MSRPEAVLCRLKVGGVELLMPTRRKVVFRPGLVDLPRRREQDPVAVVVRRRPMRRTGTSRAVRPYRMAECRAVAARSHPRVGGAGRLMPTGRRVVFGPVSVGLSRMRE